MSHREPLSFHAIGKDIVGDCRVSQVVDIRKGVHCLIPKSVFVNYKPAAHHLGKD